MKKIIGASSVLVLAALLGMLVVEKSFGDQPPPPSPAPTNAVPALISFSL